MLYNECIGDFIIIIVLLVKFIKCKDSCVGFGGYGYLLEYFDMGVFFVVVGLVFKFGVKIFVMCNLEVYLVLVKILGLKVLILIDGQLLLLVLVL